MVMPARDDDNKFPPRFSAVQPTRPHQVWLTCLLGEQWAPLLSETVRSTTDRPPDKNPFKAAFLRNFSRSIRASRVYKRRRLGVPFNASAVWLAQDCVRPSETRSWRHLCSINPKLARNQTNRTSRTSLAQVNFDHDLINQLNNHYNKNRHIEVSSRSKLSRNYDD